jgi:spoIIIJ-associated protein
MDNKEIQNLIEEIINHTGLVLNSIVIDEKKNKDNSNSVWFRVDISEPHVFVSRDGEALLALNHVVKRIIESKNKDKDENIKRDDIIIDINNFQKSKIDNIHAIAHMMAERARYFKANMEIEPMSAFERRIVHEFLSDAEDLDTESDGTGPNRRVIIKYKGSL